MLTLRPNQKDALRYAMRVQHPMFFMEMRLGKTLTTIRYCKRVTGTLPVLVVSPYCALDGWVQQLKNDGVPVSQIRVLTGDAKERFKKFIDYDVSPAKWYLINKEGYLSLPEVPDKEWGAVVLDESPFIKSPKSGVTKFYTKNFRDVPHRVLLSGKPDPESVLDYITQLNFIDPNILKMNYYQFKNKFCKEIAFDVIVTQEGKRFLQNKLAEYAIFQSKKDYNFNNEYIHENRIIEMPKEAKKLYLEMANTFMLEYQGTEIKTMYAGAAYITMRRIAGGFIDDKTLMWDAKMKQLLADLQGELAGESVVVWCDFVNEILHLTELLRSNDIATECIWGGVAQEKRDEIKHDFQEKKFRVLIAQPTTFKYGVDLSSASTIIYYSLPTSNDTYTQSRERTIDIQKANSVLIIHYLTKGTVDEALDIGLRAKNAQSELTTRIVKNIQKLLRENKIK
jgi:SNF2 family DNA or RNA helicase